MQPEEKTSPLLERNLTDQAHVLGGTVSVAEIFNFIEQDRYMTVKDAVNYLPFSERTIRSRLGEIPHFRCGGKIIFKKSELDQWMEIYRAQALDSELDLAMKMAEGMLAK